MQLRALAISMLTVCHIVDTLPRRIEAEQEQAILGFLASIRIDSYGDTHIYICIHMSFMDINIYIYIYIYIVGCLI